MKPVRYDGEKAVVKMIGGNGNIYSIIARVSKALERQLPGGHQIAADFRERIKGAKDYDEALSITDEYYEEE